LHREREAFAGCDRVGRGAVELVDLDLSPRGLPEDQALYTPVLDDRTGRTDQVSFGIRGIPSLGDIGQYDSSIDPLVGGADNPYPASYPNTPQGQPTLAGEFGQDSTSDYFSNLNYWASGTVHGPGGFDKPSEGLLRGVEFIATWFSYVIASPEEGGAVNQPDRPVAYFEMTPKKPTAQTTVTFDAGFSGGRKRAAVPERQPVAGLHRELRAQAELAG
jgi:hypothetical protein